MTPGFVICSSPYTLPNPLTSDPMGLETAAIYAIASIATIAIGTGVSIYSQNQQQKTTDRIAAHNN